MGRSSKCAAISASEEGAKQGNLVRVRQNWRTRNIARRLSHCRLQISCCSFLQLLELSKNACSLSIEIGETLLEICDFLA